MNPHERHGLLRPTRLPAPTQGRLRVLVQSQGVDDWPQDVQQLPPHQQAQAQGLSAGSGRLQAPQVLAPGSGCRAGGVGILLCMHHRGSGFKETEILDVGLDSGFRKEGLVQILDQPPTAKHHPHVVAPAALCHSTPPGVA